MKLCGERERERGVCVWQGLRKLSGVTTGYVFPQSTSHTTANNFTTSFDQQDGIAAHAPVNNILV